MSGEPRDLGLQDLPGLSGARGWQGPEASTSAMGISCQARSRGGQSAPPLLHGISFAVGRGLGQRRLQNEAPRATEADSGLGGGQGSAWSVSPLLPR